MPERPPRTLLQQLIRQRGTSYERLAHEFEAFARTHEIDATLSGRHLQRLARLDRAGDGPLSSAQPGTRRLLREFFGYSFQELVGPPHLDSPAQTGLVVANETREMVAAAAAGSLDFLAWAEDDKVPPAVLEHISSELRRIAIDYVHRPLPPLFADLVELRDSTFRLLRDRPHPQQARELFFVAGTVCCLLAHASQNMGHSSAARTQAATAWACAAQADHNDLGAWVRGTQALIAEWTDSHDQAIAFAQDGQRLARSTESRARLAAIEARTRARAGDVAGAIEAVDRAARQHDEAERPDSLAEFGGLLTFPYVKQQYYAGSTLALAGQYAEAEERALDAIHRYEIGPAAQRSYGDEALARVDVAVARVATDDVDGATAALRPLLGLPPGQRIQQIAVGLTRVQQRLALPRFAQSRAARALSEDISSFSDVSARPVVSPE